MTLRPTCLALALAAAIAPWPSFVQEQSVNVYRARHCPGDELLYSGFTKATSIKINHTQYRSSQDMVHTPVWLCSL